MSAPDLQALLKRVASLERSVLPDADAVPYFIYIQGTFPYFVNYVRGPNPIEGDSEGLDRHTYDVVMRLVLSHVTTGAMGEPETRLYSDIPAVVDFFNNRPHLIDDDHPDELIGLEEARLVECSGFSVFQQTGVNVSQLGTQFTLRVTYLVDLEPVHT